MKRIGIVLVLLASCAKAPQSPRTEPGAPPPTAQPAVESAPAAAPPPTAQPTAVPGSIEGTVLDPAGKGFPGALVAAVSYDGGFTEEGSAPAALARSDEQGRFRLSGLPPGSYGATATAPGLVAAYRGELAAEPGQTAGGIELKLGEGPGASFSGFLRTRDSKPIVNAQIRAVRYSSVAGDVFYAETDSSGAYSIALPQANYMLLAVAEGLDTGQDELMADQDRKLDFTMARATRGPAPTEVLGWIGEHALRLTTPEAGHGFADLEPLREVIGPARVVALGEATHGTREFFQLKHRMLEFLASEMGFTVFAIEATLPEAFDVNRYVLTGEGDPAKALAGLYFWTWNTEEVLEMIRWMRRYNEDPTHEKKLKFYGFDMQFAPRAAKTLAAYLRRVDPDHADLTAALSILQNPFTAGGFGDLSEERIKEAVAAIAEILRRLDASKADYVARSSEADWAVARQHARVLQQNMQLSSDAQGFSWRDKAMAENVRWILEQEGPEAKIVLWAHNAHVSSAGDQGLVPMGKHLRSAFGAGMVVFGFAFYEGSFQAVEMPFGSGRGLRDFTVGPAPEGSLDETLARAGLELAALDLRHVPPDAPAAEWLAARHTTRSVGSGFSEARAANYLEPMVVPEHYDALLFVRKTTAARPNQATPPPSNSKAATSRNLDFEDGQPGAPEGWLGAESSLRVGYVAETVEDRAYRGKRCLSIRHEDGWHYGEFYGSVSQRLDAMPYRGRRMRLRAAVRAEVSGPDNQAYLWLRVSKPGFGPQAIAFYDNMADRPIVTPEWREVELTGDVPADAETLDFGFAMAGDGQAWLDAVSIEADAAAVP